MAGTTSASQQESHILAPSMASCQNVVANGLIWLGKGEMWRGLAVACAALLSSGGLLAPHVDPQILASALFVAGAGLALIAGNLNLDAELNQIQKVKSPAVSPSIPSVPHANAQRVRRSQTTLAELSGTAESSARQIDSAHWGKLTQRMSHELRTPLNAVIGFSELMSAEVFGPLGSSQYCDYARSIHASGRSLLKSAEDALAITHLLTRSNTNVDQSSACVGKAISDMLAFHQAETQMLNLDLALDVIDTPEVMAEAQTLRQVLINLMSQAIENAAPGADVCVRSYCCGDEVKISLHVAGARPKSAANLESFDLVLARTLIQLSQGRLEENSSEDFWSATAILPRASQRDFFAA